MWNSDATGACLLALAVASALAVVGCTAAEVGTCLRHSDCGSGKVCSDGTCVTQSHAPPADGDASSMSDADGAAMEAGDDADGASQAEAATGEASEVDTLEAGTDDSDAGAGMDADVEEAAGVDAQDDAAPDGS